MESEKNQIEQKTDDDGASPAQQQQNIGTTSTASSAATAAAAAAAAAGAGGDTERDSSAGASTALHPVVKQKCLFTTNHTQSPQPVAAPPIKTTNFNVTAIPFVSTQHLRLPAAIAPKENGGGAIGGCSGLCASGSSPHLAARMCAPLQHIPSMPHTGPKGVDTRIWRSISARHVNTVYSYDDEMNRAYASNSQYSIPFSARRNSRDMDSSRSCGPIALSNGTIQIRLREGIRVDMTLDKAVRVTNMKSRIVISLASTASSAALIHPNGKVYQYGTRVEIVAYDGMQNNNFVRYAKMWYKGVSFTSENCALIYLVDSAGTRTTTDSFSDMSKDYTFSVFLNDSRHGPVYVEEALTALQNSNFWCNDDGTEVFDINGFRISQTPDGLVKVTRSNNKCLIRTSPGNGSATLTTPSMHCTASLGQTSHLFVRRGERRMHFDGSSFVVRNAGHSAGFDDNNLLKVY